MTIISRPRRRRVTDDATVTYAVQNDGTRRDPDPYVRAVNARLYART